MGRGYCLLFLLVALLSGATSTRGADAKRSPYDEGAQFLANGRYEDAIKSLTDAIQTGPTEKRAYRCRGFAFLLSGNPKPAILDFTRAARIDPNDAVAYYGRGMAHHFLGDESEALADLGTATRLDPEYVGPYMVRAEIHGESGGLLHAMQLASEVPAMLKAVSALVKNIKTKGWKDDTDFGTGKRAEVGQLLVYQGWSAIYKEYRRLKPAPAAPAAAAKDPRSSAILQATGGDLAGALASIGKAIDAAPKDASLHKLRGAMHVIHRDMTAAIADFSAAIEVNPKDTESYRHRADIYGKTGQTEKAIADQRTIMRLHDEERAESERKLREQEQKMRELQEKLRELEKDAR